MPYQNNTRPIPSTIAILVEGRVATHLFGSNTINSTKVGCEYQGGRGGFVSDQDLKEAAKKKQVYHEKQASTVETSTPRRGEIISLQQTQGAL